MKQAYFVNPVLDKLHYHLAGKMPAHRMPDQGKVKPDPVKAKPVSKPLPKFDQLCLFG